MRKILVIEDERASRKLILKLLQNEGFEAIGAENGSVGLQLALQECPDLILCDIRMPEMDGYEVLSRLQQDPVTAMIPVICLTAQNDRADLRRGMELGANDYLTKPFTTEELLSAIATQLTKQEMRAKQQQEVLQQAISKFNNVVYYDSLTNLPNRLLLRERFYQILAPELPNNHSIPIAVLSLDHLDRFIHSLGTDYSDLLLQAVSDRLLPYGGKVGTIARLNSEQLALILPPVSRRPEAANIAQSILDTLSQSFDLEGFEVFLTSSIGMALYPEDGTDIDTLLKAANTAMKVAQQLGGNRFQLYTADISEKSYDRLMLEMNLHHALERSEFIVYYQPQVDLRTGRMVGAEALVRWQHPERGLISPLEFIPIAEESGLIIPLNEWVLQTACQQARIWQKAGYGLRVAVNLSGIQFNQPGLSQRIMRILEATGLEPSYLELELTESAVVKHPETAIATLRELKTLGIKLSLDDFGTGYSSFSYLQQFPFDVLKVDRSFVRNVTEDSKNAAILMAIIQLAHSLNLKVVAEGVETFEQQEFLRQHQCDMMQGYYFSKPVTANILETMLVTHST
ncbi:MAG TPA: GGDEF domain-containing response regulator [Cyanobacteria bacterium UBA11369]|nr:GGDEF domain-containing response regulator [Cyanobacteria bacterium UBA11371]HBE30298.1 GGDEF domain-containing response regulator [Cyanobacteria bacterium UBA11368]HBE52944.1 GGDEF domain-containing response regulator [Cyanobacteria bacterium UBA11369]